MAGEMRVSCIFSYGVKLLVHSGWVISRLMLKTPLKSCIVARSWGGQGIESMSRSNPSVCSGVGQG